MARAPVRTKIAYHHGDLRVALVEASIVILAKEGLAGLTLRSAARSVGVSHAAPKNHFGDLRGLLEAVAIEGFRRLADALSHAYAESLQRGAAEALLAVGPAYVAFAVAAPGHFRAMFNPSLADRSTSEALEAASRRTFGLLVDAIKAAQAEGSVRPGDPVLVSLSAWAIVHGLATLAVDDQLRRKGLSNDPVELAREAVRDLLEGLRPPSRTLAESPRERGVSTRKRPRAQ